MFKNKTHAPTGLPYHPFLEHWGDGLRVITAKQNVPTKRDIKNLEISLKWKLPKPYKAFQLNFGALYFEAQEQYWPEALVGDVGPAWTSMRAFIIYGLAKNLPDWLNVEIAYHEFRKNKGNEEFFLPIHRRDINDGTFVGFNKDGILLEKNIHSDFQYDIEMNFDEFIVYEAKEMAIRLREKLEYDKARKAQ